jgi:hypothetical protein
MPSHIAIQPGRIHGEEEDEKANAVYTMGLSLSEKPLLSHPRYKDLPEKKRKALQSIQSGKDKDDQGNKLHDKIESELGVEALAKIERVQIGYYSPRVIWRNGRDCLRRCESALRGINDGSRSSLLRSNPWPCGGFSSLPSSWGDGGTVWKIPAPPRVDVFPLAEREGLPAAMPECASRFE